MTLLNTKPRRGLLIGAGYFSDFHLDAWSRLDSASIVCVCDVDEARARAAADKFSIDDVCMEVSEALSRTDIDFIDIATGPSGRSELLQQVFQRDLPIICQKPLANDFAEASNILDMADASRQLFMVHENFRYQPWYREIKRLLDGDVIGRKLHSFTMRTRLGDGWGPDAYLNRQPYFRSMPRLLIHETGVHFVDTFRFLGGEIIECFAKLKRFNDAIVGEDAGIMTLTLESGATAVWDANRYNESNGENPRYTFGQMWIEAEQGSISLDFDGTITIKPLGKPGYQHAYTPSQLGFAGDCVLACQQHFIDVLDGRATCETSAPEYRKTLRFVEAVYESAQRNRPIRCGTDPVTEPPRRRVIDLSLPVNAGLPGAVVTPCKTIDVNGWNATTLSLYSHAGTHMDAPVHFLRDGATLDAQDLTVCCGPARLVNLPDTAPRHLITVEDVVGAIGTVFPGDRLLIRTDWHRRYGTPAYRDELPRISIELARWLVEKQVALIGVEPPSVADVNNRIELTDVHQTLFRGGVVIVEGLANLDQIQHSECDFIALPLNIVGGDGCPVRAIAMIDDGVGT